MVPAFARSRLPRPGMPAEESARLCSVYFRPWTLNKNDVDRHVPHLLQLAQMPAGRSVVGQPAAASDRALQPGRNRMRGKMSAADHAARASSYALPGISQQAMGSGGSSGVHSTVSSEAATQPCRKRMRGKMSAAEHASHSSLAVPARLSRQATGPRELQGLQCSWASAWNWYINGHV
eukprot:11922945-Karenia_brevis.AAC.1